MIGKKILITGGTGFIGSHLTERLLELGAKVSVLARMNSTANLGWLTLIKHDNLNIIFGDINDLEGVEEAVKGHDIVFHLASIISIPYSYIRVNEVFSTNLNGTLNVLKAAKKNGISRLVYVSSSEVYGSAIYTPINETHPLQGQSPYSASKIAAEKAVESFYKSYNLPAVIVRPFNTYGPRQSLRAVIPTIIKQVLWNEIIALGALDTKRDFTYVSDTVSGIISCGKVVGIDGEVINLGAGDTITIGKLVEIILNIKSCKKNIVERQDKFRPIKSEVQCLLSDNSKAKLMLDWGPQIQFLEGLSKTISWLEENKHYCIQQNINFI